MRVDLLVHTPQPERTVALAARLCYSPVGIEELGETMTDDQALKRVRMLRKLGHHSPLEHASFTVGVEGVSRALTHQLVRSRIASYSQQSQRYVKEGDFERVEPPSIRKDPQARQLFLEVMERSRQAYMELTGMGIPSEDARFVLGQGFASRIIVTMNARSWNHWFSLRCCNRAQWEIRALAARILEVLKQASPALFEDSGPPCVAEGICREGKKSCGRIHGLSPRPSTLHLRALPPEPDQ